jgi:Zn-dependent protease with chaperone function
MRRIKKLAMVASLILTINLLALPFEVFAQTQVSAPKNPYSVQKDVELGSQAAAEVERQLPLVNDRGVQSYLDQVGRRLASAIPANYQHPEFRYSFKVVDVSDLNAFALPGGFMYVNRGMIQASRSEGELAGVMSHELSHVALRHGTAQAAKAQKYAVGQVAGQILGAIIGGGAGNVIAAGSQLGIGAYFLKFSREYERQADTLGAQIMANAGYDPRDLANVFRTIERESGGKGGPEWLSSHPNPGNRYEAINREADLLRVRNSNQDSGEFNRIQARLRDMPGARSMEDVARSGQPNPNRSGQPYPNRTGSRNDSRAGEPPSRSLRTFRASTGLYQVGYPENWEAYSQDGSSVTLAPAWAIEGNDVTRGAIVNYFEPRTNNRGSVTADDALNAVIDQLLQGNPNLRENRSQRYQGNLSGQRAMATFLNGRNTVGENERVWVIARPSGQGVIYIVFIAPDREFSQYESTFSSMVRSFSVDSRYSR